MSSCEANKSPLVYSFQASTGHKKPDLLAFSSLPSSLASFLVIFLFSYLLIFGLSSFLSFFLSLHTFFIFIYSIPSSFSSFHFMLVPGESGIAYVKLRDESQVTEFIEVFNGSTVGEDGQDQHTIMLSRYDIDKV